MHDAINYLQMLESDYERELSHTMAELELLPEGRLICRNKRGKVYYTKLQGRSESGITNDWNEIGRLARKLVLAEQRKRLIQNMEIVRCLKSRVKSLSLNDIVSSFSASYQEIPLHVFYSANEREWSKKDFISGDMYLENRTIITNKGVSVRSKSEQIIGNALEARGLEYHYEERFEAGGQIKYPDFTIQQPSTGKLIYWEHHGVMGNAEYVRSMMKKLYFYLENGLILAQNLICTFEEDTKDSRRINQIIDWILR